MATAVEAEDENFISEVVELKEEAAVAAMVIPPSPSKSTYEHLIENIAIQSNMLQ